MRRYRVLAAAAAALTLLLAVVLLAIGQVRVVTTTGTSMEPQLRAGDLVVVSPARSYGVGDVVAYHSELLDTTVLHRVVAVETSPAGDRFTLQGDNNDWLDPEQPTAADVLGAQVLHVPSGGRWLEWATHPAALAGYTFLLLTAGGTLAAGAHRGRRRQRRIAVCQNAIDRRRFRWARELPHGLRVAAAAVAGVVVLAVALLAVTASDMLRVLPEQVPGEEWTMTFDYAADVPPSPAYDGTTVSAPDAVFRRLTDTVEVSYRYRGEPGTVEVAAELGTAAGWRSTVPLAEPVTFTGDEHAGAVRLDLADLEARATAAAEVTGLPSDRVDVAVVPTVTTADGETFAPSLDLVLAPLTLALAEGADSLEARQTATAAPVAAGPRPLDLLGVQVTESTARLVAIALLAVALLAAAGLAVAARWLGPTSEAAGIRRRYAALLLLVEPIPLQPGRPVVDVPQFASLARLAERYGLLVLHWNRSGVETFVVQDEGTTYRYRTGVGGRRRAGRVGEQDAVAEQNPVGGTVPSSRAVRG